MDPAPFWVASKQATRAFLPAFFCWPSLSTSGFQLFSAILCIGSLIHSSCFCAVPLNIATPSCTGYNFPGSDRIQNIYHKADDIFGVSISPICPLLSAFGWFHNLPKIRTFCFYPVLLYTDRFVNFGSSFHRCEHLHTEYLSLSQGFGISSTPPLIWYQHCTSYGYVRNYPVAASILGDHHPTWNQTTSPPQLFYFARGSGVSCKCCQPPDSHFDSFFSSLSNHLSCDICRILLFTLNSLFIQALFIHD